jgi:Tol biopolymer transport system component
MSTAARTRRKLMRRCLIGWLAVGALWMPHVAFAGATQTETDRIFFSGCPVATTDGDCKTVTGERMRTEILSITPDGSNVVRVTTNNKYEQFPVWSPSGNTMVFEKGGDAFGCSFNSVLARVDSGGGDDENLTTRSYRCDTPSDWSADGLRILYSQECALCTDVYSIRPDGSRKKALTHLYKKEDPDVYAGSGEWIDDGRRVLYGLYDYPDCGNCLMLMNRDGSHKHRYGVAGRRADFDVSVDDDVAFVVYEDGHSILYVGDSTGHDVHPITRDVVSGIDNITWSPDGSRILFVGYEGNGFGSLYVINRDGTGLTSLDSPELDMLSTREIYGGYWSPDSTRIAFPAEAPDYQSHAVAVMNADGSDVRLLTGYARHTWVWGWERVPD